MPHSCSSLTPLAVAPSTTTEESAELKEDAQPLTSDVEEESNGSIEGGDNRQGGPVSKDVPAAADC